MRIVAVSKRQPVAEIQAACDAGLIHFGENYVQEAVEKIPAIDSAAVWHFIGPVQSNKTRPIAEHFDWVHTVASERIAERLSAQRAERQADLNTCIQLRPANAGQRHGVDEPELPALAEKISALPGLRLRGLMIMPLPNLGEAATRAEFERANGLFEAMRNAGLAVDTLSMGMSADLEAAIMAGSTCIRVGTDLFGARK